MGDDIYYRLREVLDTIPSGFPSTPEGMEILLLKKIFSEEEAELTTKLLMKYETAAAIAERIGMDPVFLDSKLWEMQGKGQIWGVKIGDMKLYKLLPFVFGIYEFQNKRLDKEFVTLASDYMHAVFGNEYFSKKPQLFKVVPIEQEIPNPSEIHPYESISKIIEGAKAWGVTECICKKERKIMGHECSHPIEVCIAIAPIENFFDDHFLCRPITREEAFRILDMAERSGLVHMANNYKNGHMMICNCCGCCCGVFRAMKVLGHWDAAAKSNFTAMVDGGLCTGCGICLDRCQVTAIDMDRIAAVNGRCIGCGLCVTDCPTGAIQLVRRNEADFEPVPRDEKDWMRKRNRSRGRGDEYKKLL